MANRVKVGTTVSYKLRQDKQDPHPCIRIFQNATVSSKIRRYGCYPVVDHLDLVLSSDYNHHSQWLVDKPNVLRQHNWTQEKTPCKKLERKNQANAEMDKEPGIVHPFIGQDKYRNSINHISVSLSSHHLPSTELGYGRKAN